MAIRMGGCFVEGSVWVDKIVTDLEHLASASEPGRY